MMVIEPYEDSRLEAVVELSLRAGMSIVMAETGGDPGHRPARQAYESAVSRRSR